MPGTLLSPGVPPRRRPPQRAAWCRPAPGPDRGGRVQVRRPRRSDLARLSQFLAWPERTATTEGALGFIQGYLEQSDGRRVIAGIWADHELVGGIVLFHHDPVSAVIELGCWAVTAAEGKGAVRAAWLEGLRLARAWGVERVQ